MNTYEEQINKIAEGELPWDLLKGKRLLISGATGMIGKCLIDVLMLRNTLYQNQIQIIAMSRNRKKAEKRLEAYLDSRFLECLEGNVNAALPQCGPAHYIIHAASNTHPTQYAEDPIGTITSNIIGTKNLLDYAVTHHTQQFCFLSSVEIYGENRGDTEAFDESYLGYLDCNTLRAGYPEGKRVGETLCNAYKEAYGLSYVIPRLSRIYGPTLLETDTKAISQFIQKALRKEDIILKSKGEQKYSYTYVTDAVNGLLYTMLLGTPGNAYNIADRQSDITLKELAEMIAHIAGTTVKFQIPEESERKGYSTATKAILNAEKLEALGWKAKVHLEEGLGFIR